MGKQLWIFFFFFLVGSSFVVAIGISPAQSFLDFQPQTQHNLSITVLNGGLRDANVSLSFSGDLASFIIYDSAPRVIPSGGYFPFSFLVDFPLKAGRPGKHLVQIHAVEYPLGKTTGILPLTAVSASLYITVPYSEKYAELEIQTHDVNAGEPIPFTFLIKNLGIEDISDAFATLEIFNNQEYLINTLKTKPISLAPTETAEVTLVLPPDELQPGPYVAAAILHYDGEVSDEIRVPFRVGTLSVSLLNYTKIFKPDTINKFFVDVMSNWNTRIDQLSGEIAIQRNGETVGSTVRIPVTPLDPWERKTITSFWDTSGLETGSYTALITLTYLNATTQEEGAIIIEKPFRINTTVILSTLIILILFINALVWLHHRRKEHENT